MTSWNSLFGELRSISQATPDNNAWEQLMGLLLTSSADPALREQLDAIALPYLERALERWPTHLRALTPPMAEALDKDPAQPLWSLVRTIPVKMSQDKTKLQQQIKALPAARALDASWAMLGDGAISWLSSAGIIASFDELILRWNKLESKHIKHLLEGAKLASLRTLDLSYNDLKDTAITHLAAKKKLQSLRSLSLIRCQLTSAGVIRLLKKPDWSALRLLDLSTNEVHTLGARALRASALHLEQLILNQCHLDDDGIHELAQSELSALRHLELARNHATDARLAELLATPQLAKLEHLAIPNTAAASRTCGALASNPALGELRRLSLNCCRLGADDVMQLAHSPHLLNLNSLYLDSSGLADDDLARLADSPLSPQIESLDLTRTHITRSGLARLIEHPNMSSLRAVRAEHTPAAAEPDAPDALREASGRVDVTLARRAMTPYQWPTPQRVVT
jgi:Leucine-rich repeat (LRR) protein